MADKQLLIPAKPKPDLEKVHQALTLLSPAVSGVSLNAKTEFTVHNGGALTDQQVLDVVAANPYVAPPDPNAALKTKIDAAVADTLTPQKVRDVLTEWKTRL